MKTLSEMTNLAVFLLRRLRAIRHSYLTLVLVVVAGIVAGFCNTSLIAVTNAALHTEGAAPASLVWKFLALCLLLPVTRLFSQLLLIHLTARIMLDLRMHLCRQILSAPLSVLERVGAHRLLAALTDDIPTISGILAALPVLSMNLTLVLSCLIYLGWLSQTMLVVVIVFIVVGVTTYQLPVIKAMRHFRSAREERDSLFKHFGTLTHGIKELKLHRRRRESFVSDLLTENMLSLKRHLIAGSTIYTIGATWGHMLSFVMIGFILFVVSTFKDVSSQVLTGYTLIALYIVTPLEVVLNLFPSLGRAKIAVQAVDSLGISLEADATEPYSAGGPDLKPVMKSVQLVDVTHAYRDEDGTSEFRLGPIDLSFRPGELVFLVGGNGSGKTTFAKLLTGLYTPETGEVRVNGITVDERNADDYRQFFSAVFSEFCLFESLLGLDAPDLDRRARYFLEELQLASKVEIENGKLSTIALSRGQCKRLALLTAYLEDRPFYVFDEWAADQDSVFKEIFYHQILPELKARGKTILAISHDEKYYHVADRIIKLSLGKLEYIKENSAVDALPKNLAGAV